MAELGRLEDQEMIRNVAQHINQHIIDEGLTVRQAASIVKDIRLARGF